MIRSQSVRSRCAACTRAGTVTLIGLALLAACQEPPPAVEDRLVRVRVRELEIAPSARQLESPVRIALGPPGRLVVSDFRARTVVEFRMGQGTLVRARELALRGPPLGVAWTNNTVLVGNAATGSVDVYGANGQWLYALGGPGAFTDPTDIAVDDESGLAFVIDGRQGVAKVFDLESRALSYTISGPGLGEYELQNPTAITLDPVRLEVLISDYGEPTEGTAPPRIKIFAYDGAPLATISGKAGMLGQRFSRPQGLAVDGRGHIFMVDAVAGEVQVLDRESGNLVKTLGTFGSGPGELWLPLDVVLDEDLDLFITNNRPGRIEVFAGGGKVQ